MGIEDRQAKEARFEAVSESIRKLWRPEAEKVFDLVDQGNNLIVVGAPSGSGKSTNLLPELVAVGIERGYSSWSLDCQTLPSRRTEEFVKALGNRLTRANVAGNITKGVAVLDEPFVESGGINNVLEVLRNRNLKNVVSLFRTNTPLEEQTVNDWITVGGENGEAFLYRMQPKQLPEKLAREFLATYDDVSPELIAYIVKNFPLYPRVLHFLRSGEDEKGVREQWRDLVRRVDAGWGFTREEAEIVNQRLKKEL